MPARPAKTGGRDLITAADEAGRFLVRLQEMHRSFFPERPEEDFVLNFLTPLLRSKAFDAKKYLRQIDAALEATRMTGPKLIPAVFREAQVRLAMYIAACAYATAAHEIAQHSPNTAWWYLSEASYWMGMLEGRMSLKTLLWQSGKALDKRHQLNRTMKADVFAWCDANMARFRSMDKAAEALLKVEPVAFRTLRGWVGEWKKLRAAGKA